MSVALRKKLRHQINEITSNRVDELFIKQPNKNEETCDDIRCQCCCSWCNHKFDDKGTLQPCWHLVLHIIVGLTTKDITTSWSALPPEIESLLTVRDVNRSPLVLSIFVFYLICYDIWNHLSELRRLDLLKRLELMERQLVPLLFFEDAFFNVIQELCLSDDSKRVLVPIARNVSNKSKTSKPFQACYCRNINRDLPSQSRDVSFTSHESLGVLNSDKHCLIDIQLNSLHKEHDCNRNIQSAYGLQSDKRSEPYWHTIKNNEWLICFIDIPTFRSALTANRELTADKENTMCLNRNAFNLYLAGILLRLWSTHLKNLSNKEALSDEILGTESPSHVTNAVSLSNHSTNNPFPEGPSFLIELTHRFLMRETSSYFIPWFRVHLLNDNYGFDWQSSARRHCSSLDAKNSVTATLLLDAFNRSVGSKTLSIDLFSSIWSHLPSPSQFSYLIVGILSSLTSPNLRKRFLKTIWSSLSHTSLLEQLNEQTSVITSGDSIESAIEKPELDKRLKLKQYRIATTWNSVSLLSELFYWGIDENMELQHETNNNTCNCKHDNNDKAVEQHNLFSGVQYGIGSEILDDFLQTILEVKSSDQFIKVAIVATEALFLPIWQFFDNCVKGNSQTMNNYSSLEVAERLSGRNKKENFSNCDVNIDNEHGLAEFQVLPLIIIRLKSIKDVIERLWCDGSCDSVPSHVAIATMIITFYRTVCKLLQKFKHMPSECIKYNDNLIEALTETLKLILDTSMSDPLRSGIQYRLGSFHRPVHLSAVAVALSMADRVKNNNELTKPLREFSNQLNRYADDNSIQWLLAAFHQMRYDIQSETNRNYKTNSEYALCLNEFKLLSAIEQIQSMLSSLFKPNSETSDPAFKIPHMFSSSSKQDVQTSSIAENKLTGGDNVGVQKSSIRNPSNLTPTIMFNHSNDNCLIVPLDPITKEPFLTNTVNKEESNISMNEEDTYFQNFSPLTIEKTIMKDNDIIITSIQKTQNSAAIGLTEQHQVDNETSNFKAIQSSISMDKHSKAKDTEPSISSPYKLENSSDLTFHEISRICNIPVSLRQCYNTLCQQKNSSDDQFDYYWNIRRTLLTIPTICESKLDPEAYIICSDLLLTISTLSLDIGMEDCNELVKKCQIALILLLPSVGIKSISPLLFDDKLSLQQKLGILDAVRTTVQILSKGSPLDNKETNKTKPTKNAFIPLASEFIGALLNAFDKYYRCNQSLFFSNSSQPEEREEVRNHLTPGSSESEISNLLFLVVSDLLQTLSIIVECSKNSSTITSDLANLIDLVVVCLGVPNKPQLQRCSLSLLGHFLNILTDWESLRYVLGDYLPWIIRHLEKTNIENCDVTTRTLAKIILEGIQQIAQCSI